MTDINLYNLTTEELKKQARILDVNLKGNPSDETIRERILEALGEKPEEEVKPVVKGAKDDWVTIVIAEDEKDQQPAFVGVNGKSYRIRRGEPVAVPPQVVEVLKHAQQIITNPKTGVSKAVPTYPFRVEG